MGAFIVKRPTPCNQKHSGWRNLFEKQLTPGGSTEVMKNESNERLISITAEIGSR